MNGHTEVALVLMDKGAVVDVLDNEDRAPLHYACKLCQVDVAIALIERGAQISVMDNRHMSPLHYVSCGWAWKIMEIVTFALIEKGADIYSADSRGLTPRYSQRARDLFERLWRQTPLLTALHSDDMGLFQAILRDDAYDLNEDVSSDGGGWTILHAAAFLNKNFDRMDYVRLLLDSGRIDEEKTTTLRGLTALHVACSRNDAEFVKAFLEQATRT